MVVISIRPMKRLKQHVTADLLTFPSSSSDGASAGPFKAKVKEFLSRHAMPPPPPSLFPHLTTWQVLFRVGDVTVMGGPNPPSPSPAAVCLNVVEEEVSKSRSVYCHQCQVVSEFTR